MISFEKDFNIEDVESYINGKVTDWFNDIAEELCTAGQKAMESAKAKTREQGGFGNITFNLRSSIGWLVQIDGQEFRKEFSPVSGGKEGVRVGIEFARSIAGKFKDGIVLVLVAGMDYAIYVKQRNRDVIQSSGVTMEAELLEAMQ